VYIPSPRPYIRGSRRPWITYIIVATNTVVYIITSLSNGLLQVSDEWVERLALVPVLLTNPSQWYRLLTSMFLHADLFHIFFNMWFLTIFGSEVERRLGHLRYLVLYILSGLGAELFHIAFTPVGGAISLIIPALGASGAISGVLGAFFLMYPRRRLSMCYFFLIPLCFTTSSAFFMVFWFATQIIYGYMRLGGVAYFAHAGGFITGISLLYALSERRARPTYTPFIPFEWFPQIRRGLGTETKVIFTLLLLAAVAGLVYSITEAPNIKGVYIVDITANGVYDQAAVALSGKSLGDVIPPQSAEPRIVFTRMTAPMYADSRCRTGLNTVLILGNPGESREIREGYYVRIRGVCVRVYVDGVAEYDELGVMKSFNGTMVTDVIKVDPWTGIVSGIDYNQLFELRMNSSEVAGESGDLLVRPSALISIFVGTSTIFVVTLKDRDLEVVEWEEIIESMPPL